MDEWFFVSEIIFEGDDIGGYLLSVFLEFGLISFFLKEDVFEELLKRWRKI